MTNKLQVLSDEIPRLDGHCQAEKGGGALLGSHSSFWTVQQLKPTVAVQACFVQQRRHTHLPVIQPSCALVKPRAAMAHSSNADEMRLLGLCILLCT